MKHEPKYSRCGNTVYCQDDGIYVDYILVWIDKLPQNETIIAQTDEEAKKQFRCRKSGLKKKACKQIKLLKKTMSIKRTKNKDGEVIKIRKVEEWTQLA